MYFSNDSRVIAAAISSISSKHVGFPSIEIYQLRWNVPGVELCMHTSIPTGEHICKIDQWPGASLQVQIWTQLMSPLLPCLCRCVYVALSLCVCLYAVPVIAPPTDLTMCCIAKQLNYENSKIIVNSNIAIFTVNNDILRC